MTKFFNSIIFNNINNYLCISFIITLKLLLIIIIKTTPPLNINNNNNYKISRRELKTHLRRHKSKLNKILSH